MQKKKKPIVLAFSGGLDTSFCAKYLMEKENYEVHTVFVNTGGFDTEETLKIEKRASALGVKHHEIIDVSAQYFNECIRYLIFGNMLRNKTYPMSVSSERTFQALAVLRYAQKNNIREIAHGSTGAGNDQVRFEMIFNILAPEITIHAPVRELKLSRAREKEYLKKSGISDDFTDYEYSINQGLWGTSIGGKETLTSHLGLPGKAFPARPEAKGESDIKIGFETGELKGGINTIRKLTKIGSEYKIGRGIHVGDTIIGIKGRVGFEAPAPLMIIQAHQALEKHVLGKWQMYWKDQLSEWYGMMLHEGKFLDPVMRDIESFLEHSQETVTGEVFLKMRPYSFSVEGISSEFDLMQGSKAKYGEMNKGWSGEDVRGFTKIMGNAMRIYYSVNRMKK
jgi:argininosuccinate synthase